MSSYLKINLSLNDELITYNLRPIVQPDSKFSAAYAKGINKKEYWDPVYEDSLDLIAKMPAIAAMIYRRTYKGDLIDADPKLDWAANLSHQMGKAIQLM